MRRAVFASTISGKGLRSSSVAVTSSMENVSGASSVFQGSDVALCVEHPLMTQPLTSEASWSGGRSVLAESKEHGEVIAVALRSGDCSSLNQMLCATRLSCEGASVVERSKSRAIAWAKLAKNARMP
mmetsp:Transcript_55558/g.88121  ORF Transcript_55558/g.88121 Transcript_55558/m.88121 type:complete len:127 (+) Transcript_55558:472-852(+)